jgi:hypothetical protein
MGTLSVSVPIVSVVNASYFTVYFDQMNTGNQVLQVQYQVVIIDKIRPNQTVTQNVYTEYASTPVGFRLNGRYHNSTTVWGWPSNTSELIMKLPTISLYVDRTDIWEVPTSPNCFLNIGELFAYRALVLFPISQSDAVVTMTFPSGIEYRDASVINIGTAIQNSALTINQVVSSSNLQAVTFNFGTIDLLPTVPNTLTVVRDSVLVEVCRYGQTDSNTVVILRKMRTT